MGRSPSPELPGAWPSSDDKTMTLENSPLLEHVVAFQKRLSHSLAFSAEPPRPLEASASMSPSLPGSLFATDSGFTRFTNGDTSTSISGLLDNSSDSDSVPPKPPPHHLILTPALVPTPYSSSSAGYSSESPRRRVLPYQSNHPRPRSVAGSCSPNLSELLPLDPNSLLPSPPSSHLYSPESRPYNLGRQSWGERGRRRDRDENRDFGPTAREEDVQLERYFPSRSPEQNSPAACSWDTSRGDESYQEGQDNLLLDWAPMLTSIALPSLPTDSWLSPSILVTPAGEQSPVFTSTSPTTDGGATSCESESESPLVFANSLSPSESFPHDFPRSPSPLMSDMQGTAMVTAPLYPNRRRSTAIDFGDNCDVTDPSSAAEYAAAFAGSAWNSDEHVMDEEAGSEDEGCRDEDEYEYIPSAHESAGMVESSRRDSQGPKTALAKFKKFGGRVKELIAKYKPKDSADSGGQYNHINAGSTPRDPSRYAPRPGLVNVNRASSTPALTLASTTTIPTLRTPVDAFINRTEYPTHSQESNSDFQSNHQTNLSALRCSGLLPSQTRTSSRPLPRHSRSHSQGAQVAMTVPFQVRRPTPSKVRRVSLSGLRSTSSLSRGSSMIRSVAPAARSSFSCHRDVSETPSTPPPRQTRRSLDVLGSGSIAPLLQPPGLSRRSSSYVQRPAANEPTPRVIRLPSTASNSPKDDNEEERRDVRKGDHKRRFSLSALSSLTMNLSRNDLSSSSSQHISNGHAEKPLKRMSMSWAFSRSKSVVNKTENDLNVLR